MGEACGQPDIQEHREWGGAIRRKPRPAPSRLLERAMNAPWFPLYAPEFLASTMSMSPEVVGAYIRLLCYAWMNGGIPDDLPTVQRISGGLSESGWAEIRARLQPHGDRSGDRHGDRVTMLVHPRMERERVRTESIREARRVAANNTNRKRRHGDRDGDRNGDRSGQRIGDRDGDRSGDRLYPQSQNTNTPHLSVGGSRGEGEVKPSEGNRAKPAASTAGRLEGAEPRPSRPDGPTPTPTPPNAPESIVARSAISRMRSPTADEMARITRRPGNSRVTDETIAAKKSVIEKILTAKGVSPELRVAVWEAGIREWVQSGTDPYEWCKGTVLADWVGVRNPNAIISHRLGIALDPVAAGR